MSMMTDQIGYGRRKTGERGVFDRILRTTGHWFSISRERRTLAHLSDRDLADIGVTRTEAEYEARRPFWAATYRC